MQKLILEDYTLHDYIDKTFLTDTMVEKDIRLVVIGASGDGSRKEVRMAKEGPHEGLLWLGRCLYQSLTGCEASYNFTRHYNWGKLDTGHLR